MCDSFEALFAAFYYETYSLEHILKFIIEKTHIFQLVLEKEITVENPSINLSLTLESFIQKFLLKNY